MDVPIVECSHFPSCILPLSNVLFLLQVQMHENSEFTECLVLFRVSRALNLVQYTVLSMNIGRPLMASFKMGLKDLPLKVTLSNPKLRSF